MREPVGDLASGLRLYRAWLDDNERMKALDPVESIKRVWPVYPLCKLALGTEGENV